MDLCFGGPTWKVYSMGMKSLKTHMDDEAHFRLKMAAAIKRMTLTKWAREVLEREASAVIEEHDRQAKPTTP